MGLSRRLGVGQVRHSDLLGTAETGLHPLSAVETLPDRLTAIDSKNTTQDESITSITEKNTSQDTSLEKLEKRTGNILNVKEAGAIDGGVANDNETKIQSLINSANRGDILFIPGGSYRLDGTLIINKQLTIIGAGKDQTTLNFVNCDGIKTNAGSLKIKDIMIYCTNTNAGTYTGLEVSNAGTRIDNIILDDVNISRFSTSIRLDSVWNFFFKNLALTFVGMYGIHTTGLSVNNFMTNVRIVAETNNTPGSIGIFFDGTPSHSEGWGINNALIFGFNILVRVQRMSHLYITNSILDFAGYKGILIESVGTNISTGIQIINNYIAVDEGATGIHDGNNTAPIPDRMGNIIKGNKIIAYVSMSRGITINGEARNNVVQGNIIKGATLHDIEAYNNDTHIISSNQCLSSVTHNINAKGLIADNTGVVYYRRAENFVKVGKMKITYDEAIPTAGTWNRGDICFQVGANTGVNIGWICTLGGTPGTWVPFGIGGETKVSSQADSVATDIATLKTDFNSLLSKMRSAGIMSI